MATAAQIEANRRNAKKSTGPRTEGGKQRSRFNAFDHGGRANMLVLPSEAFGEYEKQCLAWKQCWKPRNPSEEFLIEGIVSLGLQAHRIDQAQTARLSKRMRFGIFEEQAEVEEQVLELGQKLFRDACGPQVLHLHDKVSEQETTDGELHRVSDYGSDEDHPMRLVHQLKTSGPGCEWLLDGWAQLRELLERGMPWLAHDKLKAVRLLGRHPIDAIDYEEVARIYLAGHVLLNEGGNPFQEILNELSPEEASRYAHYLQMRGYDALAPHDAAAAREMLLEIMDRATDELEDSADVYRELEQINLQYAGHRLSWDDTPEGERLRRYEQTCKRARFRMFDLLWKIRKSGDELDLATIASISHSAPTVIMDAIDPSEPFVADDITPLQEPVEEPVPPIEEPIAPIQEPVPPIQEPVPPIEEPIAPIEANSAPENAPNEPNLDVRAPRREYRDAAKEFRVDTPHVDRKPGGIGITGKDTSHPAIQRLLGGGKSTLMNLSSIFAEQ